MLNGENEGMMDKNTEGEKRTVKRRDHCKNVERRERERAKRRTHKELPKGRERKNSVAAPQPPPPPPPLSSHIYRARGRIFYQVQI